jgi:hypothetical protein
MSVRKKKALVLECAVAVTLPLLYPQSAMDAWGVVFSTRFSWYKRLDARIRINTASFSHSLSLLNVMHFLVPPKEKRVTWRLNLKS